MPIKNGSKRGQVSRAIEKSLSQKYKSPINGATKKQKREKEKRKYRNPSEQELADTYCQMARKRR